MTTNATTEPVPRVLVRRSTRETSGPITPISQDDPDLRETRLRAILETLDHVSQPSGKSQRDCQEERS